MKKILIMGLVSACALLADRAKDKQQTDERLRDAASVFTEIMQTPDKGIPEDLVSKAHCIVIVPSMKQGAFIVGAKYGKGFISCRKASNHGWSAPGAINVEGGSFGFQIGGADTDVVLLIMNEKGADRLLSSKFNLGGEGTVAAGPVGRSTSAQTDAKMTAEILSWSRARGIFAGVSLSGATMRENRDDNAAMYGSELGNREIVDKWHPAPDAAKPLLKELNHFSPSETK